LNRNLRTSFAAALKVLTDGIKSRDKAMLSFLGVYLDERTSTQLVLGA
jgi:hypothetical protein